MVFENATTFPTPEGDQRRCPPPSSTYGFQKLAVEYFAQGAYEQYGLPYTIARPFNCVGIGERRAVSDVEIMSGNVKLALSHVLPDLVQKVLQRPGPAAHLRRRQPGATLHLRRRPRPRHPALRRTPGRDERRLQPLDRGVDDGDRTGRTGLAQDSRFGRSRSATSATSRSRTTCKSECRASKRRNACSISKPRPRSTKCSTKSCRGSRNKSSWE